MINTSNALGAVITLKRCRTMPRNEPLLVMDYTKGDCSTQYKPMLLVKCLQSNQAEWVKQASIKTIVSLGTQVKSSVLSCAKIKSKINK